METKKHTFGDLADDLSREIYTLTQITKICAFAAEARSEIETAGNEFTCKDESSGFVLGYVAKRLEYIHKLINDPAVHRDIENLPERPGL